MYITSKQARQRFGVCGATLRRWADTGKINYFRLPNGDRVCDVDSFLNPTGSSKVIYARVSSRSQVNDLDSQILYLKTRYPEHDVIEDIGSGLNWKRKGFNSLLERVMQGTVEEIVVSHKDRLCRFGFELLE